MEERKLTSQFSQNKNQTLLNIELTHILIKPILKK